jgi:CubicO group peptidase (beta-lactamase class C family)
MSRFVAENEIAGAVTLVASRDEVTRVDAVGHADIAAKKPMPADAIFWIASMTKPVTAVAVQMLEEEGKLSMDDPAAKHIPELAGLKTADGKPVRPTIRHLLTHTSGMAEASPEESRAARTLADLIPVYARKPVAFEPGARWQYCQSSINTAARIAEVVSGLPFPELLEARLFRPLGMKDTTFYPSPSQVSRMAKSYRRTPEGKLEEAEIFLLAGRDPSSRDRHPAANGGLFSTASDYARFCRMVLREGELDGRRYLKPESVRKMTAVLTGDLQTGFTPGNGWGLGWCVVRKPEGVTAALSAGSFGHGGAYGTQAWIDPEKGRAYILMVQRANFPNADASEVRRAFQEAAIAAEAR